MTSAMKITLATMAMLFAFGCEKNGGEDTAVSKHLGKEECVPASKDDGTTATLAKIASATVSLTNCLYRESDRAMAMFQQIHNEISTLPPENGIQYIKAVARSVLSVPYERLDLEERLRALSRMWDIIGRTYLPGMGKVDSWELQILGLSRIRDAIEHARSEPNNWSTRSFIACESETLYCYSEMYERDLAYKNSPQVDPSMLCSRLGEMSEQEYAIIKAKFEAFLGRPIRSYEEITRIQNERIERLKLEVAQREAERRKIAAMIEEDKRSGRKDTWHIGYTTNLQESATNAPAGR